MICENGQWLDNPPAVLTEDFLEMFSWEEQKAMVEVNYAEWEESRERARRKFEIAAALTRRARG